MEEILKPADISGQVKHQLKHGGKKRYYIGHKHLDKHYGIREGSRTDWTGYPGSGKTELLVESIWNCSNYYNHKHLINMPDMGDKLEVISKLFHKVTGKRLEKYYWTKEGRQETDYLATEQEVDRYLPEVLDYFKVFDSNKPVTPVEFWEYAVENKDKLEIFSAVIDSWNYMHHDVGNMRDDIWLAKTLQKGNDLVEQSGMHFHTIIHPRSTRIIKGKLQPPTFHEMKGGSEWGNFGKSIIVVHWEKGRMESEIHFEKVKGSNIGIKGMELMHYDIGRGKYYSPEIIDNANYKVFAAPEGEENKILIKPAIDNAKDWYEKEEQEEPPF